VPPPGGPVNPPAWYCRKCQSILDGEEAAKRANRRPIVLGARGAGRTYLLRLMAAEARARGLDVLETRDLPPRHSPPQPHPWSWDVM
jgi:hypothetical protein